MNARRGRKVIPLAAAGLTVAGVLLIPGLGASAADVASAPGEVWTQLATPLPFSGTDPVSGASRALAIAQALGGLPADVHLVGCEPEGVDELGAPLSAPVRRALEPALSAIRTLLADWDHSEPFRPG